MGRTEISVSTLHYRNFCTPHYRNFCVKVDETKCYEKKYVEILIDVQSGFRLDDNPEREFCLNSLEHTVRCCVTVLRSKQKSIDSQFRPPNCCFQPAFVS